MKTTTAVLVAALVGLGVAATSTPAEAAPPPAGVYHGGYYGGGYRGPYWGGYRGPYWGGYWGGPRVTFGFYGGPYVWGPGYWGPGYWGPGYWGGYYSSPQVVVVPSEPSVYVERDSAPAAGQQQQWWYWCASARGYYPYVSTCSEGWQRVAPQPQGTR